MDEKLKKIYSPMTETAFYILFCLQEENYGYEIGQEVERLTSGQVSIRPGTMYGSLKKMEKDGLLSFVKEEENRKLYLITKVGKMILNLEIQRIQRVYQNIQEAYHGK